jgi:hypothetical protein
LIGLGLFGRCCAPIFSVIAKVDNIGLIRNPGEWMYARIRNFCMLCLVRLDPRFIRTIPAEDGHHLMLSRTIPGGCESQARHPGSFA